MLTRRRPWPQPIDPATDELRLELHLRAAPIAGLRALFDLGDDVVMCDAYPVDAVKAHALAPLVSEPIDTEKYDFFLQRYS